MNLTLPPKAPTEPFHDESHECDEIAVYSLVDLGKKGIDGVLEALVDGNDDLRGAYRLPPKYDFMGAPLKDVYEYHLKIGSEKSLHPTMFIVAQYQDYQKNGVLLVNLDTDFECSVDTCRMKVSAALSAAVSLSLTNSDWENFKGNELPLPSSASVTQGSKSRSKPAGSQKPGQSSAPPYTFAVYTTAGANMTEIRGLLEPDWLRKAPKTHLCEGVGSYTDYPDPWEQLIKHHPWNCRRNPRLHRQWLVCAHAKDPKKEGVLLVHIDWDGNTDGDPNELLKIGLRVDVTTEKSTVENAIASLKARASKGA